jgi:RHS repeat-associated protein
MNLQARYRHSAFGASAHRPSTAFAIQAVLTLLAILFPVASLAQLTTAEEKGLPTNSVFSGGDVDVVNLENGNLHISIPLASVAQRGGSTLKWAFVYDTQAWEKQWVLYPCNLRSCQPPGYYVPETNTNVASGWRVVSPSSWTVGSTQSGIIDCQGPGFSYTQYTNFVVTDPEGAQHPLPLRDESQNCLGQTLAGPTLDGSGMYFDSQAGILYMKDGTQYTGGYSQTLRMGGFSNGQDTNGNQFSPTADTLNRDIITTGGGTNSNGMPYTTWTINDSSGNPLVFRLDFQMVTITTDICAATAGPYNCTDYTETMGLPSVLTLPTGKTYVFKYAANTPGDLVEMDLPTGAVITYQYGDFYQSKYSSGQTRPNYVGSRAVTKRTVTVNGASNSWTYTPGTTDTVTDPLGNYQVHTFSFVNASGGPGGLVESPGVYEVGVAFYNAQKQLLRTVANTYAAEWDPVNNSTANVRVVQTTTTLENGQTSAVQTDYETFTYPCANGCTGVATRMNPTERREYDYAASGAGPLIRRTDYAYLHNNNQSYVSLNIVDKPTTITVYDGNGNMGAQTVNEYDNYSHSNQPMQASGAIQHNVSYSTGYTTRGNLTAVSKWRNTDGAYVTATNQYDDAGNVLSTIDPGGHTTSYSFADSWAGTACVPSGTGAIYPTKVTNAKGQFATKTYYACTGTTANATDPNGKSTTYSYDSFDRPLQTSFPDGGSKRFCYSDDPNGACYNASSLFSTETDAIVGSTNLVQTTLYDGLGRVWETQLNSDPNGTVYKDTQFDGDGRAYMVSNPYRTSDSVYWTTKLFDGVGRSAGTIDQDGSSTSITYSGNTTLSADEAGHQRKSQTDALGRLNTVWEDPSGLDYETDYQYDILADVLQVTQKGADPNSADWRIRTFTYNSLGQLLCSANPEIGSPLAAVATCPTTDTGSYIPGTVRYSYNNDDELTSRIAPLDNQQGSSTVSTSYSYDVLHRVTNVSYSDTTPSASYTYDTDPISGCTAPSLNASNLVGHMEAMCDVSGATVWSYDTMGRTLTEKRTIGTATDQIDYSYYLNGAIQTVTYPQAGGSSRYAVTYHENAAGRTDSATGSDAVVYAQVSSTWASGAPNQWQLGSNVELVDTYNSLLQPLQTTATQISTSNTLFNRNYNFNLGSGDNGNLYGVLDGMDGLGLDRPNGTVNYAYDTLNRLSAAATTGQNCTAMNGGTKDWATTYTVDAWGNLTAKTPTLCQGESMASTTATNRNQLAAASYDSAGNLMQMGGAGYTYDAEGRLINGQGAAYTYDGMGERVANTGSKLYWKGVGSTALMEANTSDQNSTTYIFFNGARIARVDPGATAKYYVTDNVGSTEVETDASGNLLNESLFFPYGVERTVQQNDTANNYRFSGKERDPQTGLDDFGARFYDSSLGRFMTPDWDAKPTAVPYASFGDPQTLNLYSYVENGPLNRVDADGHATDATSPTSASVHAACEGGMEYGCGQDLEWGQISSGIDHNNQESADESRYLAQVSSAFASSGNGAAGPAQAQQQNVPMSKSTYKTATGAATAALDAVIGQSEKTGWEYAGRLVKLANGKYAYTSPTTEQSSTASDPDGGMKEGTRIPAGTTDAGTYHTHPTSCTYCAHDQFSGADNATAVREHLPSYMESGATRSIYLLDGSKRTSILDPTPPTVIRYGPPQ